MWTPNVEEPVELVCLDRGFNPARTGRPVNDHHNPLNPLLESQPGTYVKFHGTTEAPSTLAFTDRQLIAPLPPNVVDALGDLARHRVVAFYGYASGRYRPG